MVDLHSMSQFPVWQQTHSRSLLCIWIYLTTGEYECKTELKTVTLRGKRRVLMLLFLCKTTRLDLRGSRKGAPCNEIISFTQYWLTGGTTVFHFTSDKKCHAWMTLTWVTLKTYSRQYFPIWYVYIETDMTSFKWEINNTRLYPFIHIASVTHIR